MTHQSHDPGNHPALQAEISESFGAQASGVQWIRNVALSLESERLNVISLLSQSEDWSSDRLRRRFPFVDRIFVCNFHLEDVNNFSLIPGGYHDAHAGVLNIDKNVPDDSLCQSVTSTERAAAYLKNSKESEGDLRTIASPRDMILIQDTSCDSVLASLILGGYIPPDKIFLKASASAVHAGDPDKIGDLLQALRQERDLSFSVRNLKSLLLGTRLEERAEKLLVAYISERRVRALSS